MATAVREVWRILGAPARRRVFAALEPRGSGLAEVPPTRPQPCLPASLPEGSLMATRTPQRVPLGDASPASRSLATSLAGARPKNRLYSLLNCDALK